MLDFFIFRLVIDGKNTSALYEEFSTSLPGTLYRKLFEKNMDEESFVDKKGMKMIVENSNTALLSPMLVAEKSDEFANCQIKGVWSFILGQLSMVIAKKSPYTIFMKQLIFDMTQSGPLNLINKRWSVEKPICKLSSEVGPLAPEKIITAFFAMVSGMIVSLIIMILEKIRNKKNESQKENQRK